ncbi:MAG: NAD(P)H-hydrate epimerase, partial [Rhodobacteraceae bacterium]|nr:NAD(P)H-hydrate epimerase [Paracoccaceae bacterium]
MTELLTAAQMRAIEEAAIASGQVTGLELMERAGQGVVEAIFEEWPELARAPGRAVVLCGPGNNGGDGFVVARLLRGWGWEVEVFLYGDAERLPPDARVNYERWLGMGEVGTLETLLALSPFPFAQSVGIYVDAIFGTGLARPFSALEELGHWLSFARDGFKVPVVSVDIPSGVCCDSGRWLCVNEDRLHPGFPADLTVTFHRPKIAHHLQNGPSACGKTVTVDIGLTEGCDLAVDSFDQPLWGISKDSGHKYAHGHALILSGPPGHGGAARLAARGALRIGAGVVTVGCPPKAIPEHAARLDAVMLREVADVAGLQGVLEDGRI